MTDKTGDVRTYHHGLGRAIRNRYKLWQDKALLAEIGEEHPDDASSAIIRAVWDKLRETEAEALGFCDATVCRLRRNCFSGFRFGDG